MSHYADYAHADARANLIKQWGLPREKVTELTQRDVEHWIARARYAEHKLDELQHAGRTLINGIYGGPVRTL